MNKNLLPATIIIVLIILITTGCEASKSVSPPSEDVDITYKVQFIDQSTRMPISNEDIQVLAVIYCEMGEDCPDEILFEGKTDDEGIVNLPKDIIELNEFQVYIASGKFKDQYGAKIKHKWIDVGKWSKDIVQVDQMNREGTASVTEEFDINKDIIVVKLWHKSYWKR